MTRKLKYCGRFRTLTIVNKKSVDKTNAAKKLATSLTSSSEKVLTTEEGLQKNVNCYIGLSVNNTKENILKKCTSPFQLSKKSHAPNLLGVTVFHDLVDIGFKYLVAHNPAHFLREATCDSIGIQETLSKKKISTSILIDYSHPYHFLGLTLNWQSVS
ncbi:MAG: hypothetical protein TECD_00083 [Hyphomicrobiaceae bacterium hypho_1]